MKTIRHKPAGVLALCLMGSAGPFAAPLAAGQTRYAAVAQAGAAPAETLPVSGPIELKDEHFTVKLLSPISTVTSHQGDAFSASVTAPAGYAGGIVTGKITKIQKPRKGTGKGSAGILFAFDSLHFNGQDVPVSAVLEEVSNSKGVKNVDEEGQVVGKTSNKKRIGAAAGGALGGLLLGAKMGGAGGAIIGATAGGAAGYLIATELTTTASQIVFEPGSIFRLKVSNGRGAAR